MSLKVNSPSIYEQIARAYEKSKQFNSNRKQFNRTFDRDLLPTPAEYYVSEFPGLKIKSEWIKVKCCFHEDKTPSLSINMVNGNFRCFSCGEKGGDVLAFHRKRYGLAFFEAVKQLGAQI